MRRLTWALVFLLFGATLTWRLTQDRPSVDDSPTNIAEHPQEYVRPFEAAADYYYALLLSRRFADLDQAITAARQDDSNISDGQPLVATIYGGVCGCITNGCRNALTPGEWQRRGALLEEWRRSAPSSIPAEVAAAEYHVQYAWSMRGTEWASTVSDSAWTGFKKEMDVAEQMLEAVSPGAKEDPEWLRAMLRVGLAQHWPRMQFDAFFSAASEKYPYDMPISFLGCTYNAPRWYGSADDLHRCVEHVVDATQVQLGQTMYARINWSLQTDYMFQNGQADWPRMREGFERIIADYPDPWNINNFAFFACLARDAPTLVELQKRIGATPIEAAWRGSKDLYRQCIDAALHGADPNGP